MTRVDPIAPDAAANEMNAGVPVGPRGLPPVALRWRCDPQRLAFATTNDVQPITGVVGQTAALEALQFALTTRAAGQNVFVRGLTGTGRMTLVRRLLEEIRPSCPNAPDHCYVHNAAQPDRPRLVSLPRGTARRFERLVNELADYIRDDLAKALGAQRIAERKAAIDEAARKQVQEVVEPFEAALKEAGLALVSMPMGPVIHSAIFPMVDGKPVPPEEFEWLHTQGKVSDEQYQLSREKLGTFDAQLEEVNRAVQDIRRKHAETLGPVLEREARSALDQFVKRITAEFPQQAVQVFVRELVDDTIEHLPQLGQEDFTRRYRVNVLLSSAKGDACPIVLDNSPTMVSLLGKVDSQAGPMGEIRSDHLMIRAGSLLRADGGYLILEVRDVLTEPGAWKALMRTLRTGTLEIVPPEMSLPWWSPSIKPEPIHLDVRVILLGDAYTYALLDQMDSDFPYLFKVLSDFDSVIARDDEGIAHYAGVLSRIVGEEGLPALDRTAVATLVEHGARIAARADKLTSRFGRLADLAREAAWLAGRNGRKAVHGDDVTEAIRRTKRRADLPSRRFRELMAEGTIHIEVSGAVVGQINGLAVIQAGPMVSGFPARITATIGPGTAGVVNIEREAALSGAIHTKGFYILGGLLRHLLQAGHPLAFDASVAFEQSYGGIDGDSASGAEICCLLSALTGVPLRQDLAMTGAIDQMGHVLAVGAVNEKIEGFYDTCRDLRLTGTQGVIIPKANAGDLMLRPGVVEAVTEGRFQVFAVGTVHEALELLTGLPAGARNDAGRYPPGTLLHLAVQRAREFWNQAAPPTVQRGGTGADEVNRKPAPRKA